MNNQPILFYSKSNKLKDNKKSLAKKSKFNYLIPIMESLGLSVNEKQISAAMKTCFPAGTTDFEENQIVQSVYFELSKAIST